MNMIERDIYVLSNMTAVSIPIDYVQGTNLIPIKFNIVDYDLPDGATAKVYVKKPSTKAEFDTATIDGNSVIIDVKDSMFSETGTSSIQVLIAKESDTLVTFEYPVRVGRNNVAGELPESENRSNFLDDYIGRINQRIDDTEERLGQSLEEVVAAKNTAIENANIAVNNAEETEADRQETEQNANVSKSYMERAVEAGEKSEKALNDFMATLATQPKRYYKLSVEEMQAIPNPHADDLCYVMDLENSRTAIYFYDNADVDGDSVNPEWQFIGNAEFAQMDRTTLLKILDLATVAITGNYADLVGKISKYDSPIVLDGTADTIVWDYSQSDTALVTLTADKPLSISNAFNGAVACLQCYGALIDFGDTSTYNKSATMDFIQPTSAEHITYTLIYNAGKWDVTAMVYEGGEANA